MINEFLTTYREELLKTLIVFAGLVLLNFILRKVIYEVSRTSLLNRTRTLLIIKYVNAFTLIIALTLMIFIWSVDFTKLSLLLSSAFAVLGVALFAQWSILSNITAGVILFFSFPFKIGDRIRIQDKDFPSEAVIEDIKAFHLHLRTDEGLLITYPNNLILQKGVEVVTTRHQDQHTSREDTYGPDIRS